MKKQPYFLSHAVKHVLFFLFVYGFALFGLGYLASFGLLFGLSTLGLYDEVVVALAGLCIHVLLFFYIQHTTTEYMVEHKRSFLKFYLLVFILTTGLTLVVFSVLCDFAMANSCFSDVYMMMQVFQFHVIGLLAYSYALLRFSRFDAN